MKLIKTIYNQDLGLSKQQIDGILYLIINQKGLTNSELIRKTGLPKETLRNFKSLISPFLKEPEGDQILLKEEYENVLKDLDIKSYSWSIVHYSDKELEVKLRKIREKYNLQPKREYDQFFATVNTSIAKVKIMQDRGDILGKRIALIGDDDLLSVVLGLLEENYIQITVFDIDQDILDIIDEITKDYGFENIRTELYDARNPLRPGLKSRYDVVVTDPPYTKSGVMLFLERCIDLLAEEENKSIYLYYGNSFKTPEKTFQIQELFSKYNLLVKEKFDKFARYHGAESIGSASSLYLLKTLSTTEKPLEKKITDIYTYESRMPADFPFVEHFTFKLFEVPKRIVSSKSYVQKVLGKFCDYHGLKVVDTDVTSFSGGGYTFNYTLATSSLLVHTWPEMDAIHIVLVTCSPVKKQGRLYENLSSLFKTEKIEIEKIE